MQGVNAWFSAFSFIRTLRENFTLYRRLRNFTASAAFAGRGLYHRWGISPRPENCINFIIVHAEKMSTKITKNQILFPCFIVFYINIC